MGIVIMWLILMVHADYSHTSQDSYTTFMLTQKGLNNDGASRASILMKTGACESIDGLGNFDKC